MIAVSLALVTGAFVALLLGVAEVGEEPLRFVYASIGFCLLAAVLLAAGVVRSRPARVSPLVGSAREPSWSGAVHSRETAPRHTPPPTAPEPDGDPFARSLAPLGLDLARIERLRGRFVNLDALAAASVEELTQVPGISADLAHAISRQVGSVPPPRL